MGFFGKQNRSQDWSKDRARNRTKKSSGLSVTVHPAWHSCDQFCDPIFKKKMAKNWSQKFGGFGVRWQNSRPIGPIVKLFVRLYGWRNKYILSMEHDSPTTTYVNKRQKHQISGFKFWPFFEKIGTKIAQQTWSGLGHS